MTRHRAVTGLLITCVLSAAGLFFTAVLSYRATQRSARAILYSRASELAASFASLARMTVGHGDNKGLQELAQELATKELHITVIEPSGNVIAAAPHATPPKERLSEILQQLRTKGEAQRFVDDASGTRLEYWRPLMGFGPPPHHRVGPWQHRRRALPWRRRPWRRPRLACVEASIALAKPLIRPTQYATAAAGVAALLLLLVGVAMHRSARRAWLAEQQLQRRQALAALGEMAAVLAHEIRTPLASIKGNAQLVGEQITHDERIDTVVHETERLERLVNGMLDYARPLPINRTPSDPNTIAQRAAELVAPKAQSASVNLVFDPADSETRSDLDADQLIQVLVNLLQNAVEATVESGDQKVVTLRVRHHATAVEFEILDRGPGLQGQAPSDLLRPFFSGKSGGTGLGLAIASRIIEAHGGTLHLADREDGGLSATVNV